LKKFIPIVLSSSIGILFYSWIIYNTYNRIELKKEKAISYILSDAEKKLIQDGDVILRYGYGFVSDYIVNTFNEKYSISHCGIVSKKDNILSVIHSESSSFLSEEGIQEQDFDAFVDAGHKNSVLIVRFNQSNKEELNKITERGRYYLEKKVPFDYAFDPDDTAYMFCSEIIWHIFLDAFNKDIFLNQNGVTDFNQFKNFYDPNAFDVIINHQRDKKLIVF
jgi:hypothetical protein